MFGIDGSEFVIILIVLIVVVGPKDLPKMLKAFGKVTTQLRRTANDFRRQFDDAMRDAELHDVQKTVSDLAELDPRQSLAKNFTSVYEPIREAAKGLKTDLEVQNILMGSPKIVDNTAIDNADTKANSEKIVTKKTTPKTTKSTTRTAKTKTAKTKTATSTTAKATNIARKTNSKTLPKNNRKTQS